MSYRSLDDWCAPASTAGKLVPFILLVNSGVHFCLSVAWHCLQPLKVLTSQASFSQLQAFASPMVLPVSPGPQELSRSFVHHAQTLGNREHCLSFYFCSTHPPLPLARGWKSTLQKFSFQDSKWGVSQKPFWFWLFIQTSAMIFGPQGQSHFTCHAACLPTHPPCSWFSGVDWGRLSPSSSFLQRLGLYHWAALLNFNDREAKISIWQRNYMALDMRDTSQVTQVRKYTNTFDKIYLEIAPLQSFYYVWSIYSLFDALSPLPWTYIACRILEFEVVFSVKTVGGQSTCCLPRAQEMSILPYGFFNTHPHGPAQAAGPLATVGQAPLGRLLCLGITHFYPTDKWLIVGISLAYKLTQDLAPPLSVLRAASKCSYQRQLHNKHSQQAVLTLRRLNEKPV